MPFATLDNYWKMLEMAHTEKFAYPAINISSPSTINAALAGFDAAHSDAILQVTTEGGEFAAGRGPVQAYEGAIALADYVHGIARHYQIQIVLHTDHCIPERLDNFLSPIMKVALERRDKRGTRLFSSHMFDGSRLNHQDNLRDSEALLRKCRKLRVILEVETGVVAGKGSGVSDEGVDPAQFMTSPEAIDEFDLRLHDDDDVPYLLAPAFGNVHGFARTSDPTLDVSILREAAELVRSRRGKSPYFVFHGGSGANPDDVKEAIACGVVKVNLDTTIQAAYVRPIIVEGQKNDASLKIGDYLRPAETAMASAVERACVQFGSAGRCLVSPAITPKVFLCHATRDRAVVDGIKARLEQVGVETWFAQDNLDIGDGFPEKIRHQIQGSDSFVVFVSEAARESNWVGEELALAKKRHTRDALEFFPVRLDDTRPEDLHQVLKELVACDVRRATPDETETAVGQLHDAIRKSRRGR